MDQLGRLSIRYQSANGHQNHHVIAIAAVAIASFAVKATTGSKLGIEAKLQEGVELFGRFHVDRATTAAIPARGTATRHELLSTKSCYSVTAIATFHYYLGPI